MDPEKEAIIFVSADVALLLGCFVGLEMHSTRVLLAFLIPFLLIILGYLSLHKKKLDPKTIRFLQRKGRKGKPEPTVIKYYPINDFEMASPDGRKACADLLYLGFRFVTAVARLDDPSLCMKYFQHDGERAVAHVDHHPTDGVWTQIKSTYPDDIVFCVTGAPYEGKVKANPGSRLIVMHGAEVKQLWERFLVERPDVTTAEKPELDKDPVLERFRNRQEKETLD